jgi:hypothetical protein
MQTRNVAYHSLDTSTLHNERLSGVMKPGVYKGYRLRRSASDPAVVDLTNGNDFESVLITVEGVRVEEGAETSGVVRFQSADSSFSRYDLVVAEYRWSADNTVPQVYKIIRGAYQTDLALPPVRPQPQTIYQIPLAWVLVRPLSSLRGESRVEIRQEDIFHALKASEVSAPFDVASLKPEIDVTNRKRIYVNAGIFPNSLGSSIVEFWGDYSTEIDDSSMVNGETRYFLFGVSDEGEVSVAGSSDELSTVPEIGSDILPICVAKATKTGGITTIGEIIDIRFPFTRRVFAQEEESIYREYLRDSVFEYMRVDVCDFDTLFDVTTLLPDETGLSCEINRGDTSLTVAWTGSVEPSADVTVATENILYGTEISHIRHILVLADTDAVGVQYDYSTYSKTSGFTGTYHSLGTIQEILGGETSKLYLKFRIPSSQFATAGSKKIFSYAVCMQLSYDTLNRNSLAGLGLESLGYQIVNLIPNGDFFNWSRNDAYGKSPNMASRDKIEYTIRKADFASRKNIFAADGWQFTRMDFDPLNGAISRVLWSRDAVGSSEDNTIDTALEWKGSAWGTPPGSGQVIENHLEFRVPTYGEYLGQYVTFAIDYMTNQIGAFGIELRFYERSSNGALSIQSSVRSGIIRVDGTLLVKSALALNEKVYAVGLVIVFQQLNVETSVYLKNARAAIGRYETLVFQRPIGADQSCRSYYERGTLYNSSRMRASDDIGAAAQFGTKKLIGLSENEALKISDLENRSVNVFAANLSGSADGVSLTSRAVADGLSIIDLDWEAAVIYPAV